MLQFFPQSRVSGAAGQGETVSEAVKSPATVAEQMKIVGGETSAPYGGPVSLLPVELFPEVMDKMVQRRQASRAGQPR